MAEVLVDSSAWIEYFRKGEGATYDFLEEVLESGRVVTCGVVELELLHGASPKEKRELLYLFEALRFVEIDRRDWQSAGALLNDLRKKGKTIPPNDALLAALCLRHGFDLLTLDKHFDLIPKLSMLPAG